jgi:hypothetical protein
MANRTKKVIGHIGVDAGLCYIGDPCYLVGRELGADYDAFYTTYLNDDRQEQAWTVPYSNIPEAPGRATPVRAVVVGTGFGDGMYPVEAEIDSDGRVRKVIINFDR